MTADVNTKSRRVGLPAEAVICRGSELTYRPRITSGALSHGARGFAGRGISQSIREVQMLNVRSPTDSTRRLSGGSAGERVTRSAKRACRTSLGAAEGPLRPAR
jgi:hypothetical protein